MASKKEIYSKGQLIKTAILVTVCRITSLIFKVGFPLLSGPHLDQGVHPDASNEKHNHFQHGIKSAEISQNGINNIVVPSQFTRLFKVGGYALKERTPVVQQGRSG